MRVTATPQIHKFPIYPLRRGKNIYKLVWKDDTVRTLVTAQVDDFKAKWPKSNQKVQCNLIPPGPRKPKKGRCSWYLFVFSIVGRDGDVEGPVLG